MSKRFDIDIALNGKDNGATTAIESVAARLRLLKKEERASGEGALKGALRDPMEFLGLGGAGLAKFGLWGFAIEQGSRALEGMAQRARELRDGWNSIPAEEKVARIAGAVPVLGDIVRGVSSIVSLWGEVGDSVEEANKKAAEHKKLVDEIHGIQAGEEGAEAGRGKFATRGRRARFAVEDPTTYANEFFQKRMATNDEYSENFNKFKKQEEDLQEQLASPSVKTGNAGKRFALQHELEAVQAERAALDEWKKAEDAKTDADEIVDNKKKVEQMMEDRRALEEKGADELIADRKRWAEEAAETEHQMIERRIQQERDADAVIAGNRRDAVDAIGEQIESLQGQKQQRNPFRADLLGSRYHGVANRQESLQEGTNARLDKIIEELRKQQKDIQSGKAGIPLNLKKTGEMR